jgi:hypothetical protein
LQHKLAAQQQHQEVIEHTRANDSAGMTYQLLQVTIMMGTTHNLAASAEINGKSMLSSTHKACLHQTMPLIIMPTQPCQHTTEMPA